MVLNGDLSGGPMADKSSGVIVKDPFGISSIWSDACVRGSGYVGLAYEDDEMKKSDLVHAFDGEGGIEGLFEIFNVLPDKVLFGAAIIDGLPTHWTFVGEKVGQLAKGRGKRNNAFNC